MGMKTSLLYDKNAFLFTDDEESRIYVEGKNKGIDKFELFDVFIDEYKRLEDERAGDYEGFYEELAERLQDKMEVKILPNFKYY